MFNYFRNIEFVNPEFFLLLLLIPIIVAWQYFRQPKREVTMRFSSLVSVENIRTIRERLGFLLPLLRVLAFIFLVIAIARPRQSLKEETIKAEGIDIMLAIDLSSSMLARDFNPDRLTVSKAVATTFVDKRQYDRIGLAVFSGESYTQCPLTTDHNILKDFLGSIECGILQDGTAIGMGLASAVNRLKDSESKSKIIILLTDGVNNAGYIKPLTAAEIAKEYDVKVYTIGVGSIGHALTPINRTSDGRYKFGMSKVEIDEDLLKEISSMTGGKYFRATNEASLEQIYAEIDQLEKTEIEVNVFKRYSDEFGRFLSLGFLFFALEVIFRNTLLRTLV